MNKVCTFERSNWLTLQESINLFAERHEIISVSITSFKAGYTIYYTAIVLYKE